MCSSTFLISPFISCKSSFIPVTIALKSSVDTNLLAITSRSLSSLATFVFKTPHPIAVAMMELMIPVTAAIGSELNCISPPAVSSLIVA